MTSSSGLVSSFLDSITISRILVGIPVFFLCAFIVDILSQPWYPSSLPSVGYGRGIVGWFRNFAGYMFKHHDWVQDGFEKYTKNGRAFILPAGASRPADVVLPPSQAAWLMDHPDNVVSATDAHNEIMHSEYFFLGKRLADDVLHTRVIHKYLPRHLPGIIPPIASEVRLVVDETLGLDTSEWKEVNLWEMWLSIVSRVTNRMLVGEEVARDPVYLKAMVDFADSTVTLGLLMQMTPKILHPVVGPLLAYKNWKLWKTAYRYLEPIIRQRLAVIEAQEDGNPEYKGWKAPEDFITWIIRQAKVDGNPLELNPEVISKRLLPIEFAAIHTTVLTGQSLCLDLFSADSDKGFVDDIEEEARRVLSEEGGEWNKAGLMRLFRADSAIRESMRLSNFSGTLVERKVVARGGITNPVEGWHIPQGAFMTFNLNGVHHDPSRYENPMEYDAFRFSRLRESHENQEGKKDAEETLKMKKLGMVTTSAEHLAFGHGRHACPGRFFVAHELKMILAHIVLNYDVQHIDERPKPVWIGPTILPPLKATMKVRRKAGTM